MKQGKNINKNPIFFSRIKGFTLVELLSVIVILSVIAMIGTPIIIGIIKDAEKSAYARSANGIIDSVILLMSQNQLQGSNSNIRIDFSDKNDPNISKINVSGKLPNSGILSISNYGKEIAIVINNGKYCARKFSDDEEIEVFEYDELTCVFPYQEEILNGSYPVIVKGMTPIIYDGKTPIVADMTSEWYSYEDSLWANAVIIKASEKNKYTEVGTEILEDDILAYFVWIPRYEYTIKNGYGVNGTSNTNVGYIDINFVTAGSPKVNGSATYTGNSPENYLTHPAFTLGNEELSGIWVGKFETTSQNTNGNAYGNVVENPTIKPNKSSIRNQSVRIQYLTAQNLKNYGLENDSRMMKNDEWGAVAYLSQSLYGRCPSGDSCPEISINNSSSFLSGSSAGRPGDSTTNGDTVYSYYTDEGDSASTTGNVTGIYDMSGGAYEYVMAVLADTDEIEFANSKYYNLYTTTNINTMCNGSPCYGHSINETVNWYGDDDLLPYSSPWIVRGGHYFRGTIGGLFYIIDYTGEGSVNGSFRIVVTP